MTFFFTTAIAYPNGVPHIGHAYEYIAADTIARFKRLDGEDVFFLTGTDEHGLKMQQSAQKAGVSPRELADTNAAAFRRLQDTLGSTYDRFIRTTDEDHYRAAQALWTKMEEAGDIYLDSYSGWYSVRDEAYFTEDETEVREDGVRVAVSSGAPVEWTEEESYFFKLSAYADRLLEWYDTVDADGRRPVGPDVRLNEVASFVRAGLKDLSISRTTFDWGVPVPGNSKHVMYVWVDALTNYLTGAGYPDVSSAAFQARWPAAVHIIGKDIIRFHTVYWPAFLMSAGLPLPKRVHAHGFLFNKGEKMSKSVGNVVDPYDLVDAFGLDTLRYFLLREISYGQDGSYSAESIIGRKNADLANEYGNLVQRSTSMVAKNLGGVVPHVGDVDLAEADRALLGLTEGLVDRVRAFIDVQELHRYVEALWRVLEETNRYFSAQEPWKLKKTDPERMGVVLYVTLEILRRVSILVQPVMPESSAKVLTQLGVGEDARTFGDLGHVLAGGVALPAPVPVFPKYEVAAADSEPASGTGAGQVGQ